MQPSARTAGQARRLLLADGHSPSYPFRMSSLGLLDLIGLVGVVAYVAAHFSVQVMHQPPAGRMVVVLNIIGPACILISLTSSFNLASFLTQCFWLGLTLVGWWRHRRQRQQAGNGSSVSR
jgi:hypothetical protein